MPAGTYSLIAATVGTGAAFACSAINAAVRLPLLSTHDVPVLPFVSKPEMNTGVSAIFAANAECDANTPPAEVTQAAAQTNRRGLGNAIR